MTVTIRMHGNLRRFLPEGRESMVFDVEEGTTVDTVLRRLGAEADTWLVAVNGTVVEQSERLHEADLLECYEPIAGGRASRIAVRAGGRRGAGARPSAGER